MRKVRDLIRDLVSAGIYEIQGEGKGSHRTFTPDRFPGAVTISGNPGDEAEPYQEMQVRQAIEEVSR